MASASWQEDLRLRLVERNRKESAYAGIIEQYRRLSQQTRLLKERNQSLLRAVGTAKSNPNANGSSSGGPDSAVQAAYITSLESQISSLRDEMAAVYKTQGQNAQRLLSMNETLREKEEMNRIESENLRKAREELAILRKKVEQHDEIMLEKDRGVQVLHDEIQSLNLELNQVTSRNEVLKVDNASLLQRWLDHMNEAASKMNSANLFYEDLQSKGWSDRKNPHTGGNATAGDPLVSGNGSVTETDDTDQDPFLNLQDNEPVGKNGHPLNPNG